MGNSNDGKRLFSAYITAQIYSYIDKLSKEQEVTKVVFVKRAVNFFLEGDLEIDPRLYITKRSDPNYIARETMFTVWMEDEQRDNLKIVANIKGIPVSAVFFQCMVEYCAALLSMK